MANKDSAFGCKPVRMMGGSPYSGGQSRYRIASGVTTPLFQGDLVTQLTAGVLGRHVATGTVPIVGVFNGVSYTDPTTGEQVFKNTYPGSISASDIIANIIDDPNVVFEVQADDTFPVADLFGNFDIVDGSPVGDTKSGRSNMELDVTTGNTTATLPLKALDVSQDPDNSDVASANTNVLCVIQNHIMGQKGAGLA
jgi:outer membrane protein assembly factor BamB